MTDDVCLHERMAFGDVCCNECGCMRTDVVVNGWQYAAARAWAGLWMWCEMPSADVLRMVRTEQRMRAWQSLRDWLNGTAEEWAKERERLRYGLRRVQADKGALIRDKRNVGNRQLRNLLAKRTHALYRVIDELRKLRADAKAMADRLRKTREFDDDDPMVQIVWRYVE